MQPVVFVSGWLKENVNVERMQSTYRTVAQLVNFNNSNGTGKNKTEPVISVHKEQGTVIRLCIAKPCPTSLFVISWHSL